MAQTHGEDVAAKMESIREASVMLQRVKTFMEGRSLTLLAVHSYGHVARAINELETEFGINAPELRDAADQAQLDSATCGESQSAR